MGRRRFLQIMAGVGAFFVGVGAVVVKLFSDDTEVMSNTVTQAPVVTVDPVELTLSPGESAPVMVSVDPASGYGVGSVCISVTVSQPYDGTIEGDTALTVPAGQHWHITGDVNLTGDLIVEGLLTGVEDFALTGNGFQVLVQNGGRLDLAGVPKSAWVRWGDTPIGWQTGDRLAVAPTAVGSYLPVEVTWGGNWAATSRPASSPDVALIDGTTARPEVANLSQTVTLANVRRVHFETAGIQTLKYLRLVDCGTPTLGDYPIHFHLMGEASRGSLIEDVVVEGSKHRGFVPHGSHGVTMRGCVAYKSQPSPFWWDAPLVKTHTANNSNDTVWERCLALGGSNLGRQGTAFTLGAGSGNKVIGSVVAGFEGFDDSGKDEVNGFYWSSDANQNVGGNVWEFHDNVAHNNSNGLRAWQNDSNDHNPEDFTVYRNKRAGVIHGAYTNQYRYERVLGQENGETPFAFFALGVTLTDVVTDGPLHIRRHFAPITGWSEVIRGQFTGVVYNEQQDNLSRIRYIDCGLVPADFTMVQIRPLSEIEIVEAGLVVRRWSAGVWV